MISQWVLPTFDSAHNSFLENPITPILHVFPAQKKLDWNFLSLKEMHLNVKGANLLMQSALLAWQLWNKSLWNSLLVILPTIHF